jgi:hypothetical protein
MRTQIRLSVGVLGLALALMSPGAAAQEKTQKSGIENIRKALLQLPYYGVFDYLAFSYDKGTVKLVGYAYRPTLKKDAERAVKRVPGVDVVQNEIEELPLSPNDDDLRWKAYYAIYGDPFLSRYAPGGGMLWGHRHAFGAGPLTRFGGTRFPGMEPAGDFPIHIIVKNGRITLLGVVDSEQDKIMAGMRAREVPGAFAVENELMVDTEKKSTSR